jgi:hypothetical protein
MAVLAIFTCDVKPGRLPDFLAKLEAADPKLNSPVMPQITALAERVGISHLKSPTGMSLFLKKPNTSV